MRATYGIHLNDDNTWNSALRLAGA
jgi:hypothetical protein